MNRGNFLEILNVRRDSGDSSVEANAHKKALYTAPAIQNELLGIIARQITATLVGRVGLVFTIIADETRDASNKEQLCVAMRYLDTKKIRIEERFLCFISIASLKG